MSIGFLRHTRDIDDIPLLAENVDVIVSNGVINLAADKARVLRGTSVC